MSEIKVNSIKGVGASAAAITVNNTDGTCTANITNRTNRNLIINGAFQIAQRSVSSTSSGIFTVDRFANIHSGTNEAPTQAQVDVASGTTPYTLGFRKAYKITNGDQTSAGAGDFIFIRYTAESQDISNSGWNHTSSSSFITLSFWVKSSVAQNFFGYLEAPNAPGGGDQYPFETGSLSADTWTKITKTIPGNSNLIIDNSNLKGLRLALVPFFGTDYTNNSASVNTWKTYESASRMPDNTSTWYTTNDATFEITGVQLEVGSVATDFEHRSFGQELALCQRYFETSYPSGYSAGHNFNDVYPFNTSKPVAQNYIASDDTLTSVSYSFMVNKRASPTVTIYSAKNGASGNAHTYKGTGGTDLNVALNVIQTREQQMMLGCSLGAVNQANEMYFHYTAESEL